VPHPGHDSETIRAHRNGDKAAGRRRSGPDAFEPFVAYVRDRLTKHPDLPAKFYIRSWSHEVSA
jgi:hypothetical protein